MALVGQQLVTTHRYGAVITTVDPTKGIIDGVLKSGSAIRISSITLGAASRWPMVGEAWIVRQENYNWYLESFWPDPKATTSPAQVPPGDAMINSPTGIIHVIGSGATVPDYTITPAVVTSAIGAEQVARKGAASGYMGLDAGSRGAQPPKLHASTHAKGGGDAVALGDIATTIGDVPSALVDAMLPWRVEINPIVGNYSSVVGTWGVQLNTGVLIAYNISGAVNDLIAWDLTLAAGTWNLGIVYTKSSNTGIALMALDGNPLYTLDTYSAANAFTQLSTFSFGVGSTGKHRLSMRCTGKNASSTAFYLLPQALSLQRTA